MAQIRLAHGTTRHIRACQFGLVQIKAIKLVLAKVSQRKVSWLAAIHALDPALVTLDDFWNFELPQFPIRTELLKTVSSLPTDRLTESE